MVKSVSKKLSKSAKKRIAMDEPELFAMETARAACEEQLLPPCDAPAAPASRAARRAMLKDAAKCEARTAAELRAAQADFDAELYNACHDNPTSELLDCIVRATNDDHIFTPICLNSPSIALLMLVTSVELETSMRSLSRAGACEILKGRYPVFFGRS